MLKRSLLLLLLCFSAGARAASILIPMDETQKNGLKAYGIAYWTLKRDLAVDWLLNYRGGSFLIKYADAVESECKIRGVSYEVIPDGRVTSILTEISDPQVNMEIVKLEKAAKIAVYSPNKTFVTKDYTDAVLIALAFAEIPFDIIYDEAVLKGDLSKYEWVHLHHEDFTGQFGLNMQRMSEEDINIQRDIAKKFGYAKVSTMKLAVARAISKFVTGGGYLFAMCSAGETLDVALAADGADIVDSSFDGDGIDESAQGKLDFNKSLCFQNFTVALGNYRGFSNINTGNFGRGYDGGNDFFTIFGFSAKWDIVASMLTQDHEYVIKGFTGQTVAFNKSVLKPGTLVMGENKTAGAAKYVHGEFGEGQWTYYGGHDPEGRNGGRGGGGFGGGGFGNFGGMGGQRTTDLSLTPNSPGYRLILNNVLFPSAKKKKQKT